MTRGKKGDVQPSKEKATWNTTFVDISLTGVGEEAIFGAFDTVEGVYDHATKLLEDGYRLGFSYNPTNDAFICSVTCKDAESVNFGKTFTAFASSWYDALVVALFKHYVVASQNWNGSQSGVTRPKFG